MPKLHNTLLVSALFLLISNQALAECVAPSAPIIPDGNVASQDELVAAQRAMKAYQGELVGYRECLDGMTAAIEGEDEESLQKKAAIAASYDSSVDKETEIAEEFNGAVRAFKQR